MHLLIYVIITLASLYIVYYIFSTKSTMWKSTEERPILLPPGKYSVAVDKYLDRQSLLDLGLSVVSTGGRRIPIRLATIVYSLISRFKRLYCVAKFEIEIETEILLRYNSLVPVKKTRLFLFNFLFPSSTNNVCIGIVYERSYSLFLIAILLNAISILLLAGKVL